MAPSNPSDFLCEHLSKVCKQFVLNNEISRRIDAVLIEALDSGINEELSGYCEVENNWSGRGFKYTGTVD